MPRFNWLSWFNFHRCGYDDIKQALIVMNPLLDSNRLIALSIGLALSSMAAGPALAQKVSDENVRALNAARMRAEAINGGLSNYRAAKCMYATGAGGGDCLKSDSDSFVFVFPGGSPGWQETGVAPTVETEIRVSADGKEILEVTYNGSPR